MAGCGRGGGCGRAHCRNATTPAFPTATAGWRASPMWWTLSARVSAHSCARTARSVCAGCLYMQSTDLSIGHRGGAGRCPLARAGGHGGRPGRAGARVCRAGHGGVTPGVQGPPAGAAVVLTDGGRGGRRRSATSASGVGVDLSTAAATAAAAFGWSWRSRLVDDRAKRRHAVHPHPPGAL